MQNFFLRLNRRLRLALVLLALPFHLTTPVLAAPNDGLSPNPQPRKVALVIGNAAYTGVDELKNPVHDAELTAQTLRKLGFDVTLARNRNSEDLNRDIDAFGTAAKSAEIAVLFYAGHGTEVDGNNYLIPVDQSPQGLGANALKGRGTSIKFVQSILLASQARISIMIVDACRNPPRGNAPAGFAATNALGGVLQFYSTSPGRSAQDGVGGHSIFANALNRNLNNPALGLKAVFDQTQRDVASESNGTQTPWIVSGLVGDVNLANTAQILHNSFVGIVPPPQAKRGQEPSSQPVLRIETQAHTGAVRALDIDDGGRWAATAGDDKTVRIWDLHSNHLDKVLRPPIGDGFEGMLLALSVSPDGGTVATAGVTGQQWGQSYCIYLFDRKSGVLRQRITGLPRLISHIAFSPDGKWLAAAMAGTSYSLYVWNLQDGGTPVMHGIDDETNNALAWTSDGRLMTISSKGTARIYGVETRASANVGTLLLAAPVAASHRGAKSLSISPNGQYAAIGYFDGISVDILETRTLSLQRSLDTSNLSNHFLPSATGLDYGPMSRVSALDRVSWSHDGQSLLAAGQWNVDGRFIARIWSGANFSAVTDVPSEKSSILAARALPHGGWVLASGDGTLSSISPNGQWSAIAQRAGADLRGSCCDGALQLNASGSAVQFGFGIRDSTPYTFDVDQRRLQAGNLEGGVLPRQDSLPITDWVNSFTPKLNGRTLSFLPKASKGFLGSLILGESHDERVNALAISPDNDRFVLGTDIALRMFDAQGGQQWQQAVGKTVWGVHIAPSARLIVAALSDGTIRWYRLSDGKELLALFADADRQRWLLWTPSGYYDASSNADSLIGWHVNRGAEQAADFFSIGQFRETFHRPDVISLILNQLDEDLALASANVASERKSASASISVLLPPVIEPVALPDNFSNTEQHISVRVRSADDAPVTRLRVFINDAAVNIARSSSLSHENGIQEFKLQLPEHDSAVRILADNINGTSLPLAFLMHWNGATKTNPPTLTRAVIKKPKLWLLAVGVSHFQNAQVQRLAYADRDAIDFAKEMQGQQGKAYREVDSSVLTDANATRSQVLAGLDWLKSNVKAGDVGMVFLAGHGFTHTNDNRYYYAGSDIDPQRLAVTGIPYRAIQETLIEFNLRGDGTRAIFFIDTCHSANAANSRLISTARPSNGESLATELVRPENQVLVFASSRGDQFSWEYPALEHGAFTAALLEGIGSQWKADPYQQGRVTYKGLDAWLSMRVPALTQNRQTPRLLAPPGGVDDFSLAQKGP